MRVRYAIALAVAAALMAPAAMSLQAQGTPAPVLKKSAAPSNSTKASLNCCARATFELSDGDRILNPPKRSPLLGQEGWLRIKKMPVE